VATEYVGPDLDAAVDALRSRSGIDRPIRLSLGGCADAIGTDRVGAMRRRAHAHTNRSDANRGWVCFKSGDIRRAVTPTGRATDLLAHEWAHVATWQGHTPRFIALLRKLGRNREADHVLGYRRSFNARQGALVPCPVLAAGVVCPWNPKPDHRHSEHLHIHVNGVLYAAPI